MQHMLHLSAKAATQCKKTVRGCREAARLPHAAPPGDFQDTGRSLVTVADFGASSAPVQKRASVARCSSVRVTIAGSIGNWAASWIARRRAAMSSSTLSLMLAGVRAMR